MDIILCFKLDCVVVIELFSFFKLENLRVKIGKWWKRILVRSIPDIQAKKQRRPETSKIYS